VAKLLIPAAEEAVVVVESWATADVTPVRTAVGASIRSGLQLPNKTILKNSRAIATTGAIEDEFIDGVLGWLALILKRFNQGPKRRLHYLATLWDFKYND
jgi:hypothetical protein